MAALQTVYRFTCDRCKARFESKSADTLSSNEGVTLRLTCGFEFATPLTSEFNTKNGFTDVYAVICRDCARDFANVWFSGTRTPNRSADLPAVLEEPVF